ncbi:MAG: DUF438 domain-containing protein [Candidatus Omnitrophica bacterium]|nr:DUF438 domain-containing protein [Candidatus Omnitrophota bacterium]MCM8793242.1 DUF438 domain-containing protein [Candidatus Omnitrophota bacterium]
MSSINLKGLDHHQREALIFSSLDDLSVSDNLRLIFDFNPLPLVYLLKAKQEFEVNLEKDGPQEWIVEVKRIKPSIDMEERKKALKAILSEIKSPEVSPEIKEKAKQLFGALDAKTLGILEQELIQEGIPHQEIREKLCTIHLDILKETLVSKRIEVSPPHPVHTFMEEHKHILESLGKLKDALVRIDDGDDFERIKEEMEILKEVSEHLIEAESHHQREEDVLFPKLARYGITEPVEIMKTDHIEFKERKKNFYQITHRWQEHSFEEYKTKVLDWGSYLVRELESHIFKEDNILYQIALQILTPEEWEEVKKECDRIGYCCFVPEDKRMEVKMREEVERALEKIRPALQADGGDVELVSVEEGIVKVRLTGACGGCPMSQMTLAMGVERAIKKEVPEVKRVIAV